METNTNVYHRISEMNKNKISSRKRILVFLLAFLLPFGSHRFYLGYYIKGLIQLGILICLILFIPHIFFVILFSVYYAWITYEGLTYLLWYDCKDGDGFKFYQQDHPPVLNKKKVILLSFILPFGLHHFYLGHKKLAMIEWGFVAIELAILIQFSIVPIFRIDPTILLIVVVVSWIEGLYFLFSKRKLSF